MIQVVCSLELLEIEACEGEVVKQQFIKVRNHWNDSKKVVLEINGEKYIVLAMELDTAIENCTNTGTELNFLE